MLYLCSGLAIADVVLLCLSLTKRKAAWWLLLFAYNAVGIISSAATAFYYGSLPGSGPMPGLAYAAETYSAWLVCGIFVLMLVINWIVMAIVINRRSAE